MDQDGFRPRNHLRISSRRRPKNKGVGKGQSNRRSGGHYRSSSESPDRAEDVKEKAVAAGPSPGKSHDMEDIAWKTVDTDEEILEKGNGKWINLRITEHQRSSSDEDDDGSNGRFVYFGTAAQCVESLNQCGQAVEEKDPTDEERDIIYDKKEFTVRSVSKKKAEPEAMEVPPSPPPSSSPSKTGSRKGRRKRRNSHRPKEQQASTSKAKDSPRGSHGDRKSGPSRKKAGKGRDSQPQQSDSPSPIKGPPSPLYEAAPMFKPPSRRVVVELSSDSEGEAGGDRVQLFDRSSSPRRSRVDTPLARGSRYGPAGKPLNAGNEEIDSSPESYRNKVDVARSLSTSKKTKLYLAKRPDHSSDKLTWISVRCQ